MKHIFKSLLTLVCCAVAVASCVTEEAPLASVVSVDKTSVEFDGQNVKEQTVTVTADGDWFAIAPEWVKLTPSNGNGSTEVKISAADNVNEWKELMGPRSGVISFCYGTEGIAVLSVQQKGENGLDTSREYSKVSKTEEMSAGSYLIVFKDGEKNYAAKPFSSSYSYLYADEFSEKDGVISTPNSVNAFVFETAGTEGYKIKMSNGLYLYLDGSHTSFNSTSDVNKAHVWSVSIEEEGLATITNVTLGGYYMQYSTSYGSAGAYTSAQGGALKPILYKDSKPATDEILVVPGTASVPFDATEYKIPVQSNKSWKVRCHDEWIKTFTESGTGNGEIVLTFDANTSKTESRTASIQVIGETANFIVNFTQNVVPTKISHLVSQLTSTDSKNPSNYSVDFEETVVVSYVNGNNAYIESESGAILMYQSGHGLTAGKKISGNITGQGYLYNALPQITSLNGATFADGGEIPCTEVTVEELLKNYNSYLSRRILIKGVTVTDVIDNSDRDGKIKVGETEIAVRAQLKTLSLPEGNGDLICFPALYNKNKQLSFWDNSHFTASAE